MVRQVMPEFQEKRNVIILCDSWYVKSTMTALVDEYQNLDLIGNARIDTAIYDLPPEPTGKKGRPPKRGRKLSIIDDFTLSTEKIWGLLSWCTHSFDQSFWRPESFGICNLRGKGQPDQTFVFQHNLSDGSKNFLCVAGKRTLEPDRKQLDAVYPDVSILIPVERNADIFLMPIFLDICCSQALPLQQISVLII